MYIYSAVYVRSCALHTLLAFQGNDIDERNLVAGGPDCDPATSPVQQGTYRIRIYVQIEEVLR